jgi:hypothetical protein
MNTCNTEPPEKATALRTYTVLFAEDIPHYGSTDIEATDAAHALRVAEALDTSDIYYEASWDTAVCKRIVSIEDSRGAIIAEDIPLDHYFLRNGGQPDRLLCEAAAGLLEAVQYADQILSDFTPEALRALGLDALFEKARSAIAKATPI